MRNVTLHRLLEAYAVDAAGCLSADAASGAEVPFELTAERRRGRAPLYCYRPLTGEFIRSRIDVLAALPSHAAAARALTDSEVLATYVSEHGIRPPADAQGRRRATLEAFLSRMFAQRTGFGFEPADFEAAYAELERALYDGRATVTVIAPVLGVALDPETPELALGDGASLIRGDALPDAPAAAIWGDGADPQLLAITVIDAAHDDGSPVVAARASFRRILSALRLFERGGYAIGPVGWARTEGGDWRAVSIGVSGRPRRRLTLVPATKEDELRAFWRLVAREAPGPELAWALSRFEMGCEREAALEALTDYLLALRALLEPEGPASGRLAARVAAICGRPPERAALAERAARAVSLERAAIEGLPGEPPDALVEELSENLRAILRDTLCGHLDPDLVTLADELLSEAAVVG